MKYRTTKISSEGLGGNSAKFPATVLIFHQCITYVGILVEARYTSSMCNGLVAVIDVDAKKDANCIITVVHVLLCLFL